MINIFNMADPEILAKVLMGIVSILCLYMAFALFWVWSQMKMMRDYLEKIIICVASADSELAEKVIERMKELKQGSQIKFGGEDKNEDTKGTKRRKRQAKTGRDGKTSPADTESSTDASNTDASSTDTSNNAADSGNESD